MVLAGVSEPQRPERGNVGCWKPLPLDGLLCKKIDETEVSSLNILIKYNQLILTNNNTNQGKKKKRKLHT